MQTMESNIKTALKLQYHNISF